MRVLIVMAIMFCGTAHACQGKVVPSVDQIGRYEAVFFGEVTGVVRTAYEESIRGQGACPSTGRVDLECGISFPLFERHTVHIEVKRTFMGKPDAIQVLVVEGCGYSVPDLGDKGLFFVADGNNGVIPVYESDEAEFAEWMGRLAAGR